jgi:serine/threonine protein kinase
VKSPAAAAPPPDTGLLERILWSQVSRRLHAQPRAWEEGSPGARTIREVLRATALDPEELTLVQRFDAARETSRTLYDRLLQARVNRAVRQGLGAEAELLGIAPPEPPRIAVVRSEDLPAGPQAGGRRTALAILEGTGVFDVAGLEPGEQLAELVDLLVLANQGASEELLSTLQIDLGFHREDEAIDLLVPQSPSVQVFDLERSLAALEEVLRRAIPPELQPKSAVERALERDLTGELLGGKYRVKTLKGRGGFKSVYEGVDEMLGARVAIAVLNPKGARSYRALEHFQDEARVLTTLDHENIVRWITFDRTPDGLHFFVMEYLDGEELEKVLRREGRLPPKRVARILLQVLSALRRAHAPGKRGRLLHLDLKPDNVFLLPALTPNDPERVKVIDFGIGQHVGAEVRAAERPQLGTLYELPTEDLGKSVGSVALPEDHGPHAGRVQRARGGTLLYASPEQCKHLAGHRDIAELDGRSDLYSLGVMAFRMLTGQFPFAKCESAYQAIDNHLNVAPRKVGSIGVRVPRKLATFVDRCLQKNRDKRWRDAAEAQAFLERYVDPRVSALKVAVLFVAVGALGTALAFSTREPSASELVVKFPENGTVARRVYVGAQKSAKELQLVSREPWISEDPEDPIVVGANDEPLPGWTARWKDPASGHIVLEADLQRARPDPAAYILLEGRNRQWRSTDSLDLHCLGAWKIASITADESGPSTLDPRRRPLNIELRGNPAALANIDSLEVRRGDQLLARLDKPTPNKSSCFVIPDLGELYTGEEHDIEALNIVVQDMAEQVHRSTWPINGSGLRIAGREVEIHPSTGFINSADPGAPLLQYSNKLQALVPGQNLRIRTTAAAQYRVLVDGVATPWRKIDSAEEPVMLAVEDLGLAPDTHGSLKIEVDDSMYVDRIEPAFEPLVLDYFYTPAAPAIEALISDTPLELGATTYLSVPETALLTLRTVQGFLVEIDLSTSDGTPYVYSTRDATRIPLDLAEGEHLLRLQLYLELNDKKPGSPLGSAVDYRIRVDRTGPAIDGLELSGLPAPLEGQDWSMVGDSSPTSLDVRVQDGSPIGSLTWTLRTPSADDSSEGSLDARSSEVDLWPRIRDALGKNPDEGLYVLTVRAVDVAANTSTRSLSWHVAHTGPTVERRLPAIVRDDSWVLDSETRFNISAIASDPNVVEQVSVRILKEGRPLGEPLMLQKSSIEKDLWELRWEHRPYANFWWTDKELELVFEARDLFGLPTRRSWSASVPYLSSLDPYVVAPREGRDERMVQIRVPENLLYDFGGKRDEAKGWAVQVSGKQFSSYYLDAREVTRGEFRAFVEAPEGYANGANWPTGSPTTRARGVEAWLRELDDDLDASVTGVAWPEASAYACWKGKRLPTLIEWEFAVRGERYRDAPAGSVPCAPDSWPGNLCTGVREWTATPEKLVDGRSEFSMQCKEHLDLLLDPPDCRYAGPTVEASSGARSAARSGDFHYVVGSPAGRPASWTEASSEHDFGLSGYDDIGFRCALDEVEVMDLCDRGEYQRVKEED